ncbi:MAG: tetratricopeptide repeat protein, partial [Deltaproteobacteria bacterium]|nr:tetratricopeptide repeat protein [Deltaproteobacteria bacterium]
KPVRLAPGGRRAWLTGTLAGLWVLALAGLWTVHDDATTLRNRARRLLAQDQTEQARLVFQEALRRYPMSLVADYTWYDLALSHFKAGDYSQSEKLLAQVLDRFPDSILVPETLYHLGWSLKRQGRTAEALKHWRRLINDFPDNPWAREAAKSL